VLDLVEARRLFTDFENGRLHWSGLWVVVALCRWAEVQRGRPVIEKDQKSNRRSTSSAAS